MNFAPDDFGSHQTHRVPSPHGKRYRRRVFFSITNIWGNNFQINVWIFHLKQLSVSLREIIILCKYSVFGVRPRNKIRENYLQWRIRGISAAFAKRCSKSRVLFVEYKWGRTNFGSDFLTVDLFSVPLHTRITVKECEHVHGEKRMLKWKWFERGVWTDC